MTRIAWWIAAGVCASLFAWSGCSANDSVVSGSTGNTSGSGTGTGGSSSGSGTGGTTASGNSTTGSTTTSGTSGTGGACSAAPVPPGSGSCPAECTGGCTPQNVCVIDCMTMACSGSTIDCPPDYACEIHCNGVDACDVATVNCPPMYGCSLVCEGGTDACGDVNMNCAGGPCDVSCDTDACVGTIVHCDTGACSASCTGMPTPTVECGSACACTQC